MDGRQLSHFSKDAEQKYHQPLSNWLNSHKMTTYLRALYSKLLALAVSFGFKIIEINHGVKWYKIKQTHDNTETEKYAEDPFQWHKSSRGSSTHPGGVLLDVVFVAVVTGGTAAPEAVLTQVVVIATLTLVAEADERLAVAALALDRVEH